MNTLNRYCQKNIVAREWLNDYNRMKDMINKILMDDHLDEDVFLDYEDRALDMDTLFEHIKTNPRFEDWFIEFAEKQYDKMNSADHEVIRSGEEIEMSRQKKESKPLNIRMEAKLYDKLEQYCKDSRLPKTAAIELAVEEYLKRNEVKEVKP